MNIWLETPILRICIEWPIQVLNFWMFVASNTELLREFFSNASRYYPLITGEREPSPTKSCGSRWGSAHNDHWSEASCPALSSLTFWINGQALCPHLSIGDKSLTSVYFTPNGANIPCELPGVNAGGSLSHRTETVGCRRSLIYNISYFFFRKLN